MDHQWIEASAIAEEYVLGRLGADATAAFEEHLLECRECRERVRWADELRESLRDMAAEDRRRAAGLAGLGLLAWLAGRGRAARLGLAAALLLALALPAGLLVDEVRLRRSLAEARAAGVAERAGAAARSERPARLPRAGPPEGRGQRAAEADERDARLRQQEAALAEERRRADELSTRLAELSRPQVNAVIVSLGLVRGGEAASRVVLGPRPSWIVLSIELPAPSDGAQGGGAWRATLLDGSGRTVWSGRGLRPTANDTLVLGLTSSLLAPGGYRLVLAGPGAAAEGSGEIPFQVVRER